jgi:hypothetical protein
MKTMEEPRENDEPGHHHDQENRKQGHKDRLIQIMAIRMIDLGFLASCTG